MPLCRACDETLVLRVDDDGHGGEPSDASDTVPDDLELRCGCHFHWQCLMDESSAVALSLECPNCNSYLAINEPGPSTANSGPQVSSGTTLLARYTNEGGVQDGIDLLPLITEEAYLESNPEARPARALQVMCAEGDVGGIVELLRDANDQVSDMTSLICYQDPLSSMKTGLHLAVENKQEEVLWLLLWLTSTLPTPSFPAPVRQSAESMGIDRLTVISNGDIRGLRDAQNRTASDLAQQSREFWSTLLDAGVLSL